MTARLALLVLALGPSLGCAVSHHAREAPLGDPATPALRAEGVRTGETAIEPGEHSLGKGGWRRPFVDRDGLQNSDVNDDDVRRVVLWSVHVDGAAGVDVLDMTWNVADAPRCAGGHLALSISLDLDAPPNNALAADEQVHWERPVIVRGERALSGLFDEDRTLLRTPSVIDVRLIQHDAAGAREMCVRVPVTGPAVSYVEDRKWSLGARLEWRRALAFSASSTLMVGASVGGWVGPVRVGLEGLIGGTDTPTSDGIHGTSFCFLAPGPDCDEVDVGGFAIGANGLAWRASHWALGWSAVYEALFASIHRVDPLGGARLALRASAAGPRLGLQLLRVSPHVMGVSRLSPTSAWGFELFGAAARERSGSAAGSPVTFGVALLGF